MRAMTRDVAEKLLESFRLAPGNGSAAARHASCNPKTALKAWRKGLNVVGFPQYNQPFEHTIQQEQTEARARMLEEKATAERLAAEAEAKRQQGVRERAVKDATDTRTVEASLVRAARSTTGQALAALAQTGAGVAKVSQLVRRALESLVVPGDAGVVCVVQDPIAYAKAQINGDDGHEHLRAMGISEARGYSKTLATFATALRQVNDAAQKALEMERLLLGEPTKIIGHRHLETMTDAEAEQHMSAADKAWERFKAKGGSLEKPGTIGEQQAAAAVEADPALN